MTKKKQTRKPRLNKKQRAWVEKFKAQHPGAKLREIHEGLSGDHIVTLEWTESLPQIVLPHCTDRGNGWIFHTITVKLRVFGDPRHSAHHQYRIIYHHCSINSDLKLLPRGQLSLTLPQLLNIKSPQNPIKVKPKIHKSTSSTKKRKRVQFKLPLFGVAAQLHHINLSKKGTVQSEQELLLATVSHRDLETGKEVRLPAAIVEILKEKKASLKEWEDAISLYQVGGPSCVMQFLEGLDNIRQYFDSNQRLQFQDYTQQPISKEVKDEVKVVESEQ